MATIFKKDVDDITDFSVDWEEILDTAETILTSVWAFYDIEEVVTTDLTEVSSSNTDTTTTVLLSGGTVDTRYIVDNTITTSGGRTLNRSFYLQVLNIFI